LGSDEKKEADDDGNEKEGLRLIEIKDKGEADDEP
jgi:hypothetical protein